MLYNDLLAYFRYILCLAYQCTVPEQATSLVCTYLLICDRVTASSILFITRDVSAFPEFDSNIPEHPPLTSPVLCCWVHLERRPCLDLLSCGGSR